MKHPASWQFDAHGGFLTYEHLDRPAIVTLLRDDAEGHFREEYSTYHWIMDGLLSRAGFAIVSKTMHEGVIGRYLCIENAQ